MDAKPVIKSIDAGDPINIQLQPGEDVAAAIKRAEVAYPGRKFGADRPEATAPPEERGKEKEKPAVSVSDPAVVADVKERVAATAIGSVGKPTPDLVERAVKADDDRSARLSSALRNPMWTV